MEDVVIISGVRTAIGKFQGALEPFSAPQVGAIAVREAVKRAKVDPAQVDECIMGLVVSAGLGQNPARQAALNGGLPPTVGAMTINKVCGSGLKAVALATQAIQTGNAEIVVAGGITDQHHTIGVGPVAPRVNAAVAVGWASWPRGWDSSSTSSNPSPAAARATSTRRSPTTTST